MNKSLKHLQSLVAVALCVIMSMTLSSCSDDDEPAGDDLVKVMAGTWAQDGDNDILVISADGSGLTYNNPMDYESNEVNCLIRWSYKDGWVYLSFVYDDGGCQDEEMRAISVSKNKIVWQRYEKNTDDVNNRPDHYNHDSFGYYTLWTWERYTK
jgi:hypothetical protein